ncbi:MAG TPA: hypothetical protein VNI84_18395 [Pyrinomonadaceae bacterium]|nr:hypothetical protein [Pyrinomonadaceae bacterium]
MPANPEMTEGLKFNSLPAKTAQSPLNIGGCVVLFFVLFSALLKPRITYLSVIAQVS